ncbi:unnamed protein product [Bursaphelenchus okinawaensis]|uniref:Uncharacterized protein n=1 Tax=Bursaphelenchus okinawaensis TaxID=465554 RepID=A0A811L0F8_9BILA|nr:unnamed protein product [Bursaphelenchus okinawaensis]CAG9115216.1 unnamed protein product [Bursaphelenchus okinawaensis]
MHTFTTLLFILSLLTLATAYIHGRHARHTKRPQNQLELPYELETGNFGPFHRQTRYDRRCFFTPVNCVVYFKDGMPGDDLVKNADFGVNSRPDELKKRRRSFRRRFRQ